ncbi:MAG: hypothetical protein ACXVZ4_05155 [Gaiellaceae bacterium]
MSDLAQTVEAARRLLASGHEAKAIEILRDAIHASDDPELLRQVHELAVEAHEHAGGFHKLEWHKLVVESEPHVTPEPDTHVSG